jgi:putative ATPase
MPLLAERMRPSGSRPEHLIGRASRIWARELSQWRDSQPFHIVFWGPPGSGKTTLARMLAESTGLKSQQLSAVRDGVKEIREAAERLHGGLLFIDEIHRLSRSQQDVLLPILEEASVWIVGATTENPSVSLAPAILSRLRCIYVAPPAGNDIHQALLRGLAVLEAEGNSLEAARKRHLEELISSRIVQTAKGDVRFALNTLESIFHCATVEDEEEVLRNTLRAFTKREHYDWVSAMIKSLRGSDPDAALFYATMALDAGEDPLFILRRCVIFASEDVGNADPQALNVAMNAYQAMQAVGLPEGAIPMAQCVTYLGSTVKSNRAYRALKQVREWRKQAEERGEIRPPRPITRSGSDEYQYPHDAPGAFVDFEYLPLQVAAIRGREGPAYRPSEFGFESKILGRLRSLWSWWR